MKRILPILVFLLCVGAVSAQNPFEKFGYTPKIGTLSKGKYIEHFDTDSIVQIGSVLFNPFTKRITGFVVQETVYSEATLQPEIVSRWLTPDPLSEEFPDTSPYVFTNNNPIRFVDPLGLAPEDIIIQNKNGEELGRIILSGEDKVVTVDTDLTLPEPIVVDPSTDSTRNGDEADAVGISLDISGYMGGGMTFSYDFMYFTEGEDEGNAYWFYSYGGGPGFDGGISGGLALSYYNNEADVKDKNAQGYTGHFAGRSIGLGPVGYGKTWSNQDNLKGELWENHKSTRTWKTLNYSGGAGVDIGGKIYWGMTTLMNGGNPIYSKDK